MTRFYRRLNIFTWLLLVAIGLALCSILHAQIQPVAPPEGNFDGNLYAIGYANWSVPQGNSGTFAWSSPTFCTANSGGTTFQAFWQGTPIKIIDQQNPNHNEQVTVTRVNVTQEQCSISVTTPVYQHSQFVLTSATTGLQEGINANLGATFKLTVHLTADWYRAGGQISQVTNSIVGSTNINLVDDTTAPSNWYAWNGTHYVLVPLTGTAGELNTLQNDVLANNADNTGAIDLYNFYATSSYTPASALAVAQANGGVMTIMPSVGREAFINTGNTRIIDLRTDVPASARGATEFGAQCDLVSQPATFTSGQKAISISGINLLPSNGQSYVGRVIVAVGSVSGTPTVSESTIAAVTSSSTATVTTNFPFSQTTAFVVDIGHDDTNAITQGLSVVGSGGTLLFPEGNCLTHAQTISGQSLIGIGPSSYITGFPGENIFQGTPGQSQGTVSHRHLSFNLDQRIDATQAWQLCIEGTCTAKAGLYQPTGTKSANANDPLGPGWMVSASNGVASITASSAVICVPSSETAPAVGQTLVFPYLASVYTGTVSSTAGSCSGGATPRTLSAALPAGSTNTQAEWFAGSSVQSLATAITSGSCPSTITLNNSIDPAPGYESNVAPMGLIQVDGEQFSYFGKSNAANPSPAKTLYGVQCGVNGTTRANHSINATVVPLNPFRPAYPWPVTPTLNSGDTTPAGNAGLYPAWNVGNAVYSFPVPNGTGVGSTGSFGPNSSIENISVFAWPNDVNGQSWQGVNHAAFFYMVAPPYGTKFRSLLGLYVFYGIAEGAPAIENGNWESGQPTADGTSWDQIALWAANPVQMVAGGQNQLSNFNTYSQESTTSGSSLGADQCFFFTQTVDDQTGAVLGFMSNTEYHNLYCEPEGGAHAGAMTSWEWDTYGGQIFDQHMGGGGEVAVGGAYQHWYSGNFGQSAGAPLVNYGPSNTAEWVTGLGSDPKGQTYGTSSLIDYSYFTHFSGTTNQSFGSPTGPYGNLGAGDSREPIPAQTNETFNMGNLTAPYRSSEGGDITPEEFNSNFSFESQAMSVGWTYDGTSPLTRSYVGCTVGTNVNTIYCNTYKFNLQGISIGPGERIVAGKYEVYASLKDLTNATNTAKFTIYSNCGGVSKTFTPAITNAWPNSLAKFDMGSIDLTGGGGNGCLLQFSVNGMPNADTLQVGFLDFAPWAESFNATTINVTNINGPGGSTGCQQSPVTGINNGYTCPTLGDSTSLTASQGSSDATITVSSTSGFSSSGCFFVDAEYECYTGKTGTTFTGVARGQYLTTADSHSSGATLVSIILVLGSPLQSPPGIVAYGTTEPPIFAWNCLNPFNHGGASVFSVNCGNNEFYINTGGAIWQQNSGATNVLQGAVAVGTLPGSPNISSSGFLLQTNGPNTAYSAMTLGGGHAGSLNVIPTPNIAAPTLTNFAGTGSTTYSYVCAGTDFDGNLIPGTTASVVNGPASWAYPATIQVVCPWTAGVNTYQIYRTVGGPDQGLIATGAGPGFNTFDFYGTSSGGTPPSSNASNPHISVAGTGNPCIAMGTPSWCSGSGAPSGSCVTGSLWTRTDGGTSTTLYVCEGTPTGTWVAK